MSRAKNVFVIVPVILALSALGCRHAKTHEASVSPARTAPAHFESVTFTNHVEPSWLTAPTNLFTLGPGDRVEVEVLGDGASRMTTVVAPDGKLYFNLLPGIDVWGMTLSQVKTNLEQAFTNYMREPPRIAMTLRSVESKRIWILGRVQSPGVYTMQTPMTLLEAISMAGGTLSLTSFRDQAAAGISEELADLPRSFVLRQGKLLPLNFDRLINQGDLTQNIYLEPDDFIYFPGAMAREVYVLGAVTQPQTVAYAKGLTTAGAIASAYGTLKYAYLSHVAVVRGSLSEPQITIVDYNKVVRGEIPDVALEPHDIVYVPFSPYRYLAHYAEMIVRTFVSASAIDAGSHLTVSQPSLGTGVFIPVGSGIQVIPPPTVPPPH
jgi:polysaccharide export outer membrane protein